MTISKHTIHDEGTGQTHIIDERVFSLCVEHQLNVIRERAKELILAAAPEYKQRNAALGLLTLNETYELKQAIETVRATSNSKESEINAVTWDGQESTRSAACDAVQAVRWDD